jgi:hypothetical protein
MQRYLHRLCTIALCLPVLFSVTTQAQNTGYAPANAQGCKVWVPIQKPAPNYKPQYTGACKDGFASGKGHLDWLNTYASNRVTASWDGYFTDGLYVGTQPLAAHIEPQPQSNEDWVHLGPLMIGKQSVGELIVIANTTGDGQMTMCDNATLAIVAAPALALDNDDAVKQAITAAGARLLPLCKDGAGRSSQVNIYNKPYVLNEQRERPMFVASARLIWPDLAPAGYDNDITAKLRQQQRMAAASAKLADERQHFDAFTTRNHITAWVTAQQLDANPFKYAGKTVGLIVQLDRMLSPDTALVTGALDDDGGEVQLHGITPDFPDNQRSVLLAVRVGQREPIAGTHSDASITGLLKLDSVTCMQSGCYDWLGWQRGDNRIHWGDTYEPSH